MQTAVRDSPTWQHSQVVLKIVLSSSETCYLQLLTQIQLSNVVIASCTASCYLIAETLYICYKEVGENIVLYKKKINQLLYKQIKATYQRVKLKNIIWHALHEHIRTRIKVKLRSSPPLLLSSHTANTSLLQDEGGITSKVPQ